VAAKRHRNAIYGNDLYGEITSPDERQSLQVTYWDLWIVLTLVHQFDGDWETMVDYLRFKRQQISYRDQVEGLLSHVRALQQTFNQGGWAVEQILAGANPSFLKKQARKALTKVIEMRFQSWEKSPWMINTPRRQRQGRAMRGYWGHFPVPPAQYAGLLERQYKTSGYYSEDQSFGLKRKLSAFLRKHSAGASLSQLVALYRAFLTVVIVKMGGVDDSFGIIGDLYGEVFDRYIQFDRLEIGMPLPIFFQDLIELLIWENHAFTWKKEGPLFAGLAPDEVPLVESILHQQWQELGELELEYHAEKALTLLGSFYVQQREFEQFVPIAKAMGTREWERITTMAEMAKEQGKSDLALAVYEASLGPGMHEEFLRKKYKELKARAPRNQAM
jgi:hypothetical protein